MKAKLKKILGLCTGIVMALSMVVTSYAANDSSAYSDEQETTEMSVTDQPYKVAAVSAAPVSFGVEANLERAAEITEEAAEDGAVLVAFPELWIPGYTNAESLSSVGINGIAENSIEVGTEEWDELLDIAKDNDVYLSMSFIEKRTDNCLYMSQVLVGPDGEVIDLRSKIRPSGGEREYLSDVEMEGNLDVSPTELGRIGQLSCFEHFHPQSTYVMASQVENLHICAFPYGRSEEDANANWWESKELELSAARYYAVSAECYVVFTSIGQSAILNSGGEIIASSDGGNESDYALGEINPDGFADTPSYDSDGEYSWGVINMIRDNYYGPKEEDSEHGTLNKVEIPEE